MAAVMSVIVKVGATMETLTHRHILKIESILIRTLRRRLESSIERKSRKQTRKGGKTRFLSM